jgi:peptidyl-prolyl cis-trans isomerase B (cyclophilin B)
MPRAFVQNHARLPFITHSPTPHLDGNYTIFGKVKSGMDVVDALQMGDVMEKVTVKY